MTDAEKPAPPKCCHGCGSARARDPEDPAPHETAFEAVDEDDEQVVYECGRCEVRTAVPRNPEPAVSCRNCGREIPESLQGNHVCETHPLGLAAEPDGRGPMEEYR